ncbi:CBS domain-containing protein [Paenibacillus motobuensis]|uniref:CBS domain-containing protein n=1 Tax=Paenibacillus TaxID=44249 RepID=UPI00203A6767|nr:MULTISPECIES: CBS domain-containing protein [Paenibacillus]MCM3039759.1 CBS domain-containing protein [Paenibacillus lutimineralis]MCM3646863.1 CBS domain-containing protein [Paenibacillus motobuensis]
MKTLREIMTTNCETVSPEDDIYQIAIKMEKNNIGFIPVVDNKKLLGVVTDRDLVVRGYAAKRPGSTSATEVMTQNIVTASPDTTVDEAADIMAKEMIRRLAVVDQGELVGVVAIGDLAISGHFDSIAADALSEISQHTDVMHH